MDEKKDFLNTFNTIVLILISIVTAFTAYRTSTLTDKINNIKAVTEEGQAVSELIDKFSKDSLPTITFDFSFLSLERYLRNTTDDGSLKPQDRAMLVGFAQSIIYDRVFKNTSNSDDIINKILVPKRFLEQNDTMILKEIQSKLISNNNKIIVPTQEIKATDSLYIFQPISQSIDTIQAKSISLILKKVAYIQYSNRNKKNEIIEIQKKLKLKNWIVPGLENVKGAYKNTIRYFHEEDKAMANQANELLDNKFYPQPVRNFESKVPKGQIEIWINNN